jgi:hypothetical protein
MLDHQEDPDGSPIWSHFLGAVVLEQEQSSPGRIPRYTVIDGQQRLTTLQLLLAGAAAALREVGADDDSALLAQLTVNNPLKAKGDDRWKVWPTNANRAAFAEVMGALHSDSAVPSVKAEPVSMAPEYFRDRCFEYLRGEDMEDAASKVGCAGRAERLRITVCDLLKVVSITLDRDDNAQVIFETLNARGTPLLALDLVKNAVLAEAERRGADTDRLYREVWGPQLDDVYWRTERRQGRLKRPLGDLFIMHWLTMRLERMIPATELFATFRQRVLRSDADPEALIHEICSDAETMRSFDHQAEGSPEAQFFARLDALDAGTVLPVVLWLFSNEHVSRQRRLRALAMIESWLARRALMRMTSQAYNTQIPRMLARMKADPEHVDEALHRVLAAASGQASRWPSDEEFIESLATRDFYGRVSQARIVMALGAVEQSLYGGAIDLPTIPRDLQVEHLLPQKWEQHWPLTAADGERLSGDALSSASEARNARVHRLGNLTLVSGGMNAGLSNRAWSEKRAALNEKTKLLLNVELVGRDEWDEAAIDDRTERLAGGLAKVWPGPSAANWFDVDVQPADRIGAAPVSRPESKPLDVSPRVAPAVDAPPPAAAHQVRSEARRSVDPAPAPATVCEVVSLPPSHTNKRWAYARAEYRNADGERRVLVWQVQVATKGRRGQLALRRDLGADNIEGTVRNMSGDELLAMIEGIERTALIHWGGDAIRFPDQLRKEFVSQCLERMADAEAE